MANILLRNMMYVPAFKEKFIDKSLDAPADALIYDLEDSVPQSCKAEARIILKSYIEKGVFTGKKVFVSRAVFQKSGRKRYVPRRMENQR